MEDETKSVADFLNEITDVPEVFKEEDVSKTVEQTGTEEPEEEKPLPFHQDPKVQKYVAKEIEKALKDKLPSVESQFQKEVKEINLPDSFVRLVGNDTPEKLEVLKDLSTYFSTLKGEAKQDFIREMEQQRQQEVDAENKVVDELNASFEEIESTYGVDLNANPEMRAKFIEYVRRIAPKDESGEVIAFPDMNASFEDFQERNKRVTPPTRAKELATRGLTRSADAPVGVPQGPRNWAAAERHIESLKANN